MAGQLGFAEAWMDPRLGMNAKLSRIEALIDWSRIETLLKPVRSGRRGRPPYDPLSMMKALYLAAMYDLSDPALEEALLDRLSFRRFCGFALDAATPDETTLCRFRTDAGPHARACFEVNAQLETRGLILRKGTPMDATLVAARHNPPRGRTTKPGRGDAREAGASWTKKGGKAFFGYKAHAGVDKGSLIVRRFELTGARTSDSEAADALISWDERAVYGDRAYPQKARRAALKTAGTKDRIARRRNKHQSKPTPHQERRNELIARHRAPVEAVFSRLKNRYGRGRARSPRLACTLFDIAAAFTVHNLERAVKLAPA